MGLEVDEEGNLVEQTGDENDLEDSDGESENDDNFAGVIKKGASVASGNKSKQGSYFSDFVKERKNDFSNLFEICELLRSNVGHSILQEKNVVVVLTLIFLGTRGGKAGSDGGRGARASRGATARGRGNKK